MPAHQSLRAAIAAAGGTSAAVAGPAWTAVVEQHIDESLRSGVHGLAVEPLHSGADGQERYADAVLARMHEIVAARQVAALKSKLQRINPQRGARRARPAVRRADRAREPAPRTARAGHRRAVMRCSTAATPRPPRCVAHAAPGERVVSWADLGGRRRRLATPAGLWWPTPTRTG